MKDRTEIFEKYPIAKAVWTLALPTMIGMLVTVIYNLADTFFVGKTNDVNMVAAVSITMPIFMILMAIGTIFGIGGGTYISRMLGTKNYKRVKEISSFSFYAQIIIGIVCIILGLIFMPQLLKISGADKNTYEHAKNYLFYVAIFAPAIILAFSLGQITRAEGAAKEAMFGMMIGTVLNIILDPIFIINLKMGVAGAALATGISNLVSVVYYCLFFMKKNSYVSILPKDFYIDFDMLKSILSIGFPAALNSILMSTSVVIYNNYAVKYGTDFLAALGVISRINMLPVLLLIGLAQGVQPLVAYNFSAKNIVRMKAVLKYTIISGTIIATTFAVILFFAGGEAVRAFINQDNVVNLGKMVEKRNVLSIPILAVLFTLMSAFQAFGEGTPSLILSISRQGLVFIPFVIIANKIWGMNGLIYAQPVADILSTCLALFLLAYSLRKHKEEIAELETA